MLGICTHLAHAVEQLAERRSEPGGLRIAESRCVLGLKVLGNDKSEFKLWNEKLMNVMAQTLGRNWRTFMTNLNQELDRNRNIKNSEEVKEVVGYDNLKDVEQAN